MDEIVRPGMVLVQICPRNLGWPYLGQLRITLYYKDRTRTTHKGPCFGNLILSLKLSQKVLMHNSETVVVNSDFRPQHWFDRNRFIWSAMSQVADDLNSILELTEQPSGYHRLVVFCSCPLTRYWNRPDFWLSYWSRSRDVWYREIIDCNSSSTYWSNIL